MSETAPSSGLFASLRQLLATVLEIAQVRLEIFGNELEQEKLRISGALMLAAIGLMLLSVGTVLLCGFVLMLLEQGYRLAVLGLLTAAFLAGGVLVLLACSRRLRTPGRMFAATLGEIANDRSGLAPRE
jgi:uncharacterized membrane protein YqjE